MYQTPYAAISSKEYDPESGEEKEYNFLREVRHGFIRKVYGILFVQLAITTALTALCIAVKPIQIWMAHHGVWLIVASAIVVFITLIALLCFRNLARKFPVNYFLLLAFTLCEAVLVASVAAHCNQITVLKAAIGTLVITFGLTMFAFQTKYDFTSFMGIMLILCLTLMFFGIFALFFRKTWIECILCSLGIMVFGFYLIIDTQLLLGRKEYSMNEDDYIIAALNIYLDIINIFIYLLQIFRLFENK